MFTGGRGSRRARGARGPPPCATACSQAVLKRPGLRGAPPRPPPAGASGLGRSLALPSKRAHALSIDRQPFSPWSPLPGPRKIKAKEAANANVTLDNTRDELTVHLERAFLVSVALPDR